MTAEQIVANTQLFMLLQKQQLMQRNQSISTQSTHSETNICGIARTTP